MISIAQPLPAGNAIRIFLEPPASSTLWRVLRKGADSFTGHDDPSALIAYEGDEKVFLDIEALINDTAAFYKPYYWNGSAWLTAPAAMATPSAIYEDRSTDVLDVVSDRIRAGMQVEVQRQNILSEIGYIQVFTAPPSLERDLRFPLVTVTLDEEDQDSRAIGEMFSADEIDGSGDWFESEGWLASVQLSVTGWSHNPDERNEMRKALRRIIVANLPVFDSKGMVQIKFSQQNSDAVSGEYDTNVYFTVGTFTCLAPVSVGNRADPIIDVEVEGNSYV